jgi:hypothetical protein
LTSLLRCPIIFQLGSRPTQYSLEKAAVDRGPSSTIGRGAAISVAAVTVIFGLSLVWGIIFHSTLDQVVGYVASFLLAVSVVAMMASLYDQTDREHSIFGLLALAAAIIYATFCIANYFLQIAVVALNPLGHPPEVLQLVRFVPGSPTFAIDMLGYGFLCLSTLAAAFVLVDPKDKTLRNLCYISGAIALPTLAAPIISGVFRSTGGAANDVGSYILLLWCILFVPLALLFAGHFRRGLAAAP